MPSPASPPDDLGVENERAPRRPAAGEASPAVPRGFDVNAAAARVRAMREGDLPPTVTPAARASAPPPARPESAPGERAAEPVAPARPETAVAADHDLPSDGSVDVSLDVSVDVVADAAPAAASAPPGEPQPAPPDPALSQSVNTPAASVGFVVIPPRARRAARRARPLDAAAPPAGAAKQPDAAPASAVTSSAPDSALDALQIDEEPQAPEPPREPLHAATPEPSPGPGEADPPSALEAPLLDVELEPVSLDEVATAEAGPPPGADAGPPAPSPDAPARAPEHAPALTADEPGGPAAPPPATQAALADAEASPATGPAWSGEPASGPASAAEPDVVVDVEEAPATTSPPAVEAAWTRAWTHADHAPLRFPDLPERDPAARGAHGPAGAEANGAQPATRCDVAATETTPDLATSAPDLASQLFPDVTAEPEFPAPEPPRGPSAAFVAGAHRVVVHTTDGLVRRGTLTDCQLDGAEIALSAQDGQPEAVAVEQVKAIFFMLPAGTAASKPRGDKVHVTFRDGRQVAGYAEQYAPGGLGFFMVPADARTHTARIWVYQAAVRQVVAS